VGYPILDLENFFTDIHKYMRNLEEVIIRTIAEYGLKENVPKEKPEFGWMLENLMPENLCNGCKSFTMGNFTWFCTECQY
jgi:hypothetical protein